MKAVILAGGKGSRIFPFDRYWQKAFLPIGNKPNSLRLAEMLVELGIGEISIISGYKNSWAAHIFRNMPEVKVEQNTTGLGETLKNLCKQDSLTLVLYGDIYITKNDLARMMEPLPDNAAAATLLQSETSAVFRKGDWICAKAAEEVEAFYGHPRPRYVNSRCCGVFLLGPKALPYLSSAAPHFENVPAGGMPTIGFTIENSLQNALIDGLSVHARYVDGHFVDMDFPWDYLEANQFCCKDNIGKINTVQINKSASIAESVILPAGIIIGENCRIGSGVVFKGNCSVGNGTVIQNNVIIGENCIIGRDCLIEDFCKISANTVIGNHCKVAFTAEVAGVLMDRVAAVHNCELFGVMGTASDIGAGTNIGSLRFDDGDLSQPVQGKRYIHPLAGAVFIGDYSRTGINSGFLPGIMTGANCIIGPGVIVSKNLPHGTILLLKQELAEETWGPEKYGWGMENEE